MSSTSVVALPRPEERSSGQFIIKVRGVDVCCDSVEALDILLERYGGDGAVAEEGVSFGNKSDADLARDLGFPRASLSRTGICRTQFHTHLLSVPSVGPTALSSIESAPVRWLWQHRIPVGMLTVLYAAPGIGKGTLAATIAAVVTTGGVLPGDTQERIQGRVLFSCCGR